MNSPKDQLYPRVFGLAVVTLLGVALFWILQPFFGSILWAFLLAFLPSPVNQALRVALFGMVGLVTGPAPAALGTVVSGGHSGYGKRIEWPIFRVVRWHGSAT